MLLGSSDGWLKVMKKDIITRTAILLSRELKTPFLLSGCHAKYTKPAGKVADLSPDPRKMTAPKGSLMPTSNRPKPQIILTECFLSVARSASWQVALREHWVPNWRWPALFLKCQGSHCMEYLHPIPSWTLPWRPLLNSLATAPSWAEGCHGALAFSCSASCPSLHFIGTSYSTQQPTITCGKLYIFIS